MENTELQSTLRFRGGPKRKVLWRSVFSTDSGLLKRSLALKHAFCAPKLVASHFVSKMLHETVVIPISNGKEQKLCQSHKGPQNELKTLGYRVLCVFGAAQPHRPPPPPDLSREPGSSSAATASSSSSAATASGGPTLQHSDTSTTTTKQ